MGIWVKPLVDEVVIPSDRPAFIRLSQPWSSEYPDLVGGTRSFRLFELFPGEGTQIDGRVVLADLDENPVFTASSYCWGATRLSLGICGGRMNVPESAHAALLRLRQMDKSRLVWVDSICIKQGPDASSGVSSQVALMGAIYGNASEVAICLGEGTGDSPICMHISQDLADGGGLAQHLTWKHESLKLIARAFREVLGRGWFTRIWVVQEAALSTKLTTRICGDEIAQWKGNAASVLRFLTSLKYVAISHHWREAGFADSTSGGFEQVNLEVLIDVLQSQWQQVVRSNHRLGETTEPDLLDIAYQTRSRKSTDPRNRLFTILGLASLRQGTDFRPDYSSSVQEAYERFRQVLRTSSGMRQKLMLDLETPETHTKALYINTCKRATGL